MIFSPCPFDKIQPNESLSFPLKMVKYEGIYESNEAMEK
jgi:hypothetical protein